MEVVGCCTIIDDPDVEVDIRVVVPHPDGHFSPLKRIPYRHLAVVDPSGHTGDDGNAHDARARCRRYAGDDFVPCEVLCDRSRRSPLNLRPEPFREDRGTKLVNEVNLVAIELLDAGDGSLDIVDVC